MSVATHDATPRPRTWTAHSFAIVGTHPLVVEALEARIRSQMAGTSIIYAGPSARSALEVALSRGCDCVIADLDLGPGSSATHLISTFAMHQIPVVGLSEDVSHPAREAAMFAGARGLISKRSDRADFSRALSTVVSGRDWFPPALVEVPPPSASRVDLSNQERRTIVLYASGMTQDMVARRMGIASSTVKHYLDRVRRKANEAGYPARTKLELHELAKREGWLP